MTAARTEQSDLGEPSAPLAHWLRHEWTTAESKLLGRGYQARAWLANSPVGPVVIKQPLDSPLLGRLGRMALRSEAETYRRLAGIPGIPRYLGLIDGCLLIEHIDGPSFRSAEASLEDRDRFFARLLETLEAMHASGVAHGDLKRKDNILVGPGERPYVIDFGIAWRADPDSPRWRRAVFETVRQMDLNAWIKLKYRRNFDALAPEDAARYRPLPVERIARAIRIPWQKLTLRRWRKRRRNRQSRPD